MVLCEVDGTFTLGSPAGCTLGDGALVRIAVRRSMISQCLSFASAVGGGVSRRVLSRSCAVRIVRSSSDKAGTLQCVGYNFTEPEFLNRLVVGSKKRKLR